MGTLRVRPVMSHGNAPLQGRCDPGCPYPGVAECPIPGLASAAPAWHFAAIASFRGASVSQRVKAIVAANDENLHFGTHSLEIPFLIAHVNVTIRFHALLISNSQQAVLHCLSMKIRPLIAGVALVCAAGFAWWTTTLPRVPAPPPLRPYAASPHARAIDAALGFLSRPEQQERPDWQVYALLDYLQRRFGLDPRYALEEVYPREMWSEGDIQIAARFGRLADPGFVISTPALAKDADWLTNLMTRSLYCDVISPDDALFDELTARYMEDQAQPEPGYISTHIILCAQWLREGGGADFNQVQPAEAPFADVLESIVSRERAETDLAFEAMMLLYYLGEGARVWDKWIETMVRLQRPSGAWGHKPGHPDHGHPTVLALWVLLEHALPGVPKCAWTVAP